jgi:hypothetical protein
MSEARNLDINPWKPPDTSNPGSPQSPKGRPPWLVIGLAFGVFVILFGLPVLAEVMRIRGERNMIRRFMEEAVTEEHKALNGGDAKAAAMHAAWIRYFKALLARSWDDQSAYPCPPPRPWPEYYYTKNAPADCP